MPSEATRAKELAGLTKAQERGAEARDPASDAAYFASIWQLSNYQLKQLEDAFRASQASAVKAAGLTTQPLVPDEGAIDPADVANAASAAMPSEATRAKELAGLIERVEAATGPDRELDGLLAQAMGEMPLDFRWGTKDAWGDTLDTWVLFTGNGYEFREPEPYTASIDAAVALVERVLPGWWRSMEDGSGVLPSATIGSREKRRSYSEKAVTLPLAILLAILNALQEPHDAE